MARPVRARANAGMCREVDGGGLGSRAKAFWSGGVVIGGLLATERSMAKGGFAATVANGAEDESSKGAST
jgi:hypothetical protein